ncbi:hypothetical protein SRHO_G00211510 [Serrasalmus rhombeus]
MCSLLLFHLPSVCISIFERWLRKHQPPRTLYPESKAPIGHNDGYYMVPFIPLYRNGDYFLGTKVLGYEYAYLLDPSQRFMQEFLTPYLQHVQQIWPWLVGAGVLGAVLAAIITTLIIFTCYRGAKNQKRSPYGERQPLLHSSDEEATASYQTTL